MSKTLNTVAQSLILPLLILAYVQTGSRVIFWLIAAFTFLVFLITVLSFLATNAIFINQMDKENFAELRAKMEKRAVSRIIFGILFSIVLSLGLFFYVNSYIGIIYVLSVLLLHTIRYRLMNTIR